MSYKSTARALGSPTNRIWRTFVCIRGSHFKESTGGNTYQFPLSFRRVAQNYPTCRLIFLRTKYEGNYANPALELNFTHVKRKNYKTLLMQSHLITQETKQKKPFFFQIVNLILGISNS